MGRYRRNVKKDEIVEIWVSNEVPDSQVKEQVNRLRKEGRLIVIFRSGHKNLVEQTAELLRHNL